MGTQFWWFFDVLTLCITAGVLYGAISKGFNKLVFRLIGVVAAFGLALWGSGYLKGWFYETLYHDEISTNVQNALVDFVWDDEVTMRAGELAPEHPPKKAEIRTAASDIRNGGAVPEWFSNALGDVLQEKITMIQKPHHNEEISVMLREHPDAVCEWLTAVKDKDDAAAASVITEVYYRPTYEHLIRLFIFLLIEIAVTIIVGIIAAMAGNLETQMHIRRGNHLLAVPVGLLEVAFILLFIAIAVKLIVTSTDSEMMLFNQQTIDRTFLFRLIYEHI